MLSGEAEDSVGYFCLNQLLALPTVVRLSDFPRKRVRVGKVLPPLGVWVTGPRGKENCFRAAVGLVLYCIIHSFAEIMSNYKV